MSIGRALRQALSDFYFNSWRLAPANLAWGAVLVLGILGGPSVVGLACLVALPIPAVGVYRMAALIARGEPASFADFLGGMRRFGSAAVIVGLAATVLGAVFVTNVVLGLETGEPLGWLVSAMALWGLVGVAMLLVVLFPLLVDPERPDLPLRQRLALAGLAVIGRPVRVLLVTALVVVLLAVSSALFAILVIAAFAYVALLSSRYVLPLVDELEARLPEARRIR